MVRNRRTMRESGNDLLASLIRCFSWARERALSVNRVLLRVVPFSLGGLAALVVALACISPEVARADTFLVVGTSKGEPRGAIVLRCDAPSLSCERAVAPASVHGSLRGVVFSEPGVAWSFGTGSGGQPFLLRSSDAGRSWVNVSDRAPSPIGRGFRLVSAQFTGANTGWLAAEGFSGSGPFVSSTTNGGESWSRFSHLGAGLGSVSQLVPCEGRACMLRVDGLGGRIEFLESSQADVDLPAEGFNAAAAVEVGTTMWVAGTGFEDGLLVPTKPRVLKVEPSREVVEEPVLLPGPAQLWRIAMRDPASGIVGGIRVGSPVVPVLLRRTADGWTPGAMPSGLEGMVVRGVATGMDQSAMAILRRMDGKLDTVLATSDDGVTWEQVPLDASTLGRFRGVTRCREEQ